MAIGRAVYEVGLGPHDADIVGSNLSVDMDICVLCVSCCQVEVYASG